MRIAVFDHFVTRNNPAGSCDRRLVEALCETHDFTVFATAFENPRPDRIRFVRVPAIQRPLFLLFLSYQLFSRILYFWHTRVLGERYDLVQAIESKGPPADVIYQHFCHRHYLRHSRVGATPRMLARRLNHMLHAMLEGRRLQRARIVVVPSKGLASELAEIYGSALSGKTLTIPNPIDTRHFSPCDPAARAQHRAALGLGEADLVLVFAALGDFERKGLPLLLSVVRQMDDRRVRLLVVGGNRGLVEEYRHRCLGLGLAAEQVSFAGRVSDVRPYYWAADLFCLPSRYETFSLVAHEAASCGLPLLVTRLHGVEDFVQEGENGWTLPPTAADWSKRLAACTARRDELQSMGRRASERMRMSEVSEFVTRWNNLYLGLRREQERSATPQTAR